MDYLAKAIDRPSGSQSGQFHGFATKKKIMQQRFQTRQGGLPYFGEEKSVKIATDTFPPLLKILYLQY